MKNCSGLAALALLPVLLYGCERETQSLLGTLDSFVFKTAGVTLLSNPSSVSIKELRLSGNKADSEVVVEGKIEERSENSTYFVISDDSARMLVVTTELAPKMAEIAFKSPANSVVRVIGKVEIGKKGLPFLKASAITAEELTTTAGSKT